MKTKMSYFFALPILVAFASCTKEYSCEEHCRIMMPVTDTVRHTDTTSADYIYNFTSYHITLAGTGNNAWGYVIPVFDTTLGILDSFEVMITTSLSSNFTLTNSDSLQHLYSIQIIRHDSLTFDSIPIINQRYAENYGETNVLGGASWTDNVDVLPGDALTVFTTDHLDKFRGANGSFVVCRYDPKTTAQVTAEVTAKYNLILSFVDKAYIEMTYYSKIKK